MPKKHTELKDWLDNLRYLIGTGDPASSGFLSIGIIHEGSTENNYNWHHKIHEYTPHTLWKLQHCFDLADKKIEKNDVFMVARPRKIDRNTRAAACVFKEHIALSSTRRNRIPSLPDVNNGLLLVPFDTAGNAAWEKLLHSEDLMNYHIGHLHEFWTPLR